MRRFVVCMKIPRLLLSFRPFSMQLFLSRVTVLLALRAHAFADPIPERTAPSSEKRELPELSDLKIETSTRRAICGEMSVQFSVREFQVFSYLFAHRGKWVSREELLRDVWGTSSEKRISSMCTSDICVKN